MRTQWLTDEMIVHSPKTIVHERGRAGEGGGWVAWRKRGETTGFKHAEEMCQGTVQSP